MTRPMRLLVASFLSVFVMAFFSAVTPALADEGGSRFFAPTGYAISGKFLDYWNARGGLATFGYPITGAYWEKDPISGNSYLTQWFERNRFELHPENAHSAYEVLLGLLGRQLTANRSSEAAFQPVDASPNTATHLYFSQTGHTLSDTFKQYWETTGGLSLYGYPISETFMEKNPSDGKTYLVQYFERNRFELHPENQPPYNVLLGLLGQQIKQAKISPVHDDRTSALGLLDSYYNAINLKDYQRAYNYWTEPEANSNRNPASYLAFVNGFSQTASVNLSTGPVTEDGTAGTIYYSVPVVIISSQKDGTKNHFYGCYLVAQVDVQINNQPLPNPLFINFAKVYAASTNFDETMLLNLARKLITPPNLCTS